MVAGSVVLTLTGQSGSPCSQSSDKLTLHLIRSASLNAGPDATICEGNVYTLSGATADNYFSLKWISDGSGHFSSTTILNPTYTPSLTDIANGQVVLKLIATSDCANATSSMVLSISRQSVVKTGSSGDISSCENSPVPLNNATQKNTTSIKWSTTGTGTFANSSDLNTVYFPSPTDVVAGSVVLTLTGQSGSSCSQSSDKLTLHLIRSASLNAGADAEICEGSSFILKDAKASNTTTFVWRTSGSGSFSDPKAMNPTYFPSSADVINGTTVLTLTSASEYPCGPMQDDLVLHISRLSKINAGPDLGACGGELVKITNASAQNYTSILWTTNGKGKLTESNTLQPTYIPAVGERGKLQFVLSATGVGGCMGGIARDTAIVTYYNDLQVKVMEADTVLYNTAATLSVTGTEGTGNYIYLWMPANLVLNFNANRTQTVPLKESTRFSVTITDLLTGCTATDQVMVTVEAQVDNMLKFYNGISPNGDGNNDTWWIDGVERFPDNTAIIFNRWGDKIIELKNYDNDKVVWAGRDKQGKLVPDGTYFYVFTIKNVKSYTGWINVRSGVN